MGTDWKDCITIVFDLDGIKDRAPTGQGSRIMQDLHTVVAQAMDNKSRFPSVDRAYAPAHQQQMRLLPERRERTIYAYDHLSLDHVAR